MNYIRVVACGSPGSLTRRCQTNPEDALEVIAACEAFIQAPRAEHLVTRLNDDEQEAFERMVLALATLKRGCREDGERAC